MKTGFVLIVLSVVVAGCGGQRYAEGWYQRKAQCSNGDFTACSEIGHQARAAQGGTTQERAPAFQGPLSEPIID
ncbi:hypothetical protein [Antarcticimicrobium sediminis]|uniref:Lipoprotein n=1 Tax=Antarcticimicrobium sediminis TaxID=2546227 RepID=A0A4V2Z8E5_9RHOB|nr:hypothetical protein [Antarcticimicrobium sediminis]TDE40086.1 hypothetical protein E1B25_03770 [Antarcticimicrobium sediminis]